MFKYRAYGLVLESDVELPELLADSGSTDVIVRIGTLDEVSSLSHFDESRVVGELPGIAKVAIQHGKEILIAPFPDVTEESLRPNVLGGCMAIIMQQRGCLVLHASCVDIGGRAIAFLGPSGAGKSTLAAAFNRAGYPLLTDDVLPVDLLRKNNGKPTVIPSFARIKLWPETLQALSLQDTKAIPIYKGAQKFSCWIPESKNTSPLPLERIYVLKKGENHAILPFSDQAAFAAFIEHRRSAQGMVSLNFKSKLLYQATQLIEQVTVKQFIRRPSLEALPELVKMVEADLAA